MKKTFHMIHPKKKYARVVDDVRCEIKRYLKRERKKELPEGFNVWDFECKFGVSPETAEIVAVTDLPKAMDRGEILQLETFYIEILAHAGHREARLHED